MRTKRVIAWITGIVMAIFVIVLIGSGMFMLHYSLAPNENRPDIEGSYKKLYSRNPETQPWVDSLRNIKALRDTFVTMPSGERHHALYVWNGSNKTALVLHGWRGSSIDFLCIAQMYEHDFGYNIVVPDLHAHGLSEGEAINMGWFDKDDMMHWLQLFKTDTMVVHGVSMGGATTMMMAGEEMPADIKDIRFIDDCGYTSVWDEFAKEMKGQFGLPEFPLMYISSILCKILYGWSFGEASAIQQVQRSKYPIFFIHGDKDRFVPTKMAYRLYKAKPSKKALWIVPNTAHAESYRNHREEYVNRVRKFLGGALQN